MTLFWQWTKTTIDIIKGVIFMSTTTGGILKASADKKNVKPAEFIWYLIAVFFYTNMTGFVGQ